MKLSKLFLIGAIALGMVACNNDDVPNVQEKNATVSLKLTQAGTRAIGDNTLAVAESNIKKLDVFVFNGDARDGFKSEASATSVLEVKEIAVTTGSRTLVVVANAPEDLSGITSKAALLAKVNDDLENQTVDNGLLMTSEETTAFTIAPGHNYYGYADDAAVPAENKHSVGEPVKLTRVAARVALVGATTDFTGAYDGWEFEPSEIFLFNAKKQSKYFGASLVEGGELLSGVDLTGFDGTLKPVDWVAAWEVPYLKDNLTDLTTVTATAPIYYYTFENDPTIQPTVLSIKGKLKNADGDELTNADLPGAIDTDGFTYYSVIVNGNLGGYNYTGANVDHDGTILRNTQYNITLTIKHPGKDDPTDPPTEQAMLDVLVEVVPWVVVNQAVEY